MSGGGVASRPDPWEALILRDEAGGLGREEFRGEPAPPSGALVVLGAAGGVGATMVACGIALALADGAESVGLIEFDFARGDLAGAWGIPPDRTIDDLAPVVGELERHHVELVAHRHAANVSLLLRPAGPSHADVWDRPATARLLDRARALGAVVVDGGCARGAHVEEACAQAGRVVIVAAQTITGARRTRSLIDQLRSLGVSAELHVVANRGVGRDHLGGRSFASAVGHAVIVELPRCDRDADDLGTGHRPGRRRRSLTSAIDAIVAAVRAA